MATGCAPRPPSWPTRLAAWRDHVGRGHPRVPDRIAAVDPAVHALHVDADGALAQAAASGRAAGGGDPAVTAGRVPIAVRTC